MPKISDLTAIVGADTAAADVLPIVDVSEADATATKKITRDELAVGLGVSASQLDATIAARLNATGSAPTYAPRAWVNFNASGTLTILASGNVSSVTDNGTGDYTINFTTALPDADYAVTFGLVGFTSGTGGTIAPQISSSSFPTPDTKTASALRMLVKRTSVSGVADTDHISVVVMR